MKMNRELTKTERKEILRNYLNSFVIVRRLLKSIDVVRNYLKSITVLDVFYTFIGLLLLASLYVVFSVGCVVFG